MKAVTNPKPTKYLRAMPRFTLLDKTLGFFTIPDTSLYSFQGRGMFSLFCATESLET